MLVVPFYATGVEKITLLHFLSPLSPPVFVVTVMASLQLNPYYSHTSPVEFSSAKEEALDALEP